ncbi:glycosyltransferase [Planctomicrobium sp. SH527]|uniref:glycosyltransferase n=1 Tax=Planctomicrobium sp. SH527 TaxID=3448123 RepID=UPI003F5B4A2D
MQSPRLRFSTRQIEEWARSQRNSTASHPVTPLVIDSRGHIIKQPIEKDGICVIVTCHNYGRFLAECLDSILTQTLPATEILVVLDHCSDESVLVADRYRGRDVRAVEHHACDVYLSRRLGMKLTGQPYVVFFDADDLMTPTYLERVMTVMQQRAWKARHRLAAVTGYVTHFGFTSYSSGDARNSWRPDPNAPGTDIEKANCMIGNSLILREALESLGGTGLEDFSLCNRLGQDWETWKKLRRAGWEFDKADAEVKYRRHESNSTLSAGGLWGARMKAALPSRPARSRTRALFLTSHLNHGGVSAHFKMLVRHQKHVEWIGTVISEGRFSDPEIVAWLLNEMPVRGSLAKPSHAALHANNVDRRESSIAALDSFLDDIDVVYAWGDTSDLLHDLREKRPDVGAVFCIHGQCEYSRKFAGMASPYVDRFICVGEAVQVTLPPGREQDSVVIGNSVDLAKIGRSAMSRDDLRAAWHLSTKETAIGFVARWSGEKNPTIVPKAIAELRKRGIRGMRFVACGPQCRLGREGFPIGVGRQQVEEIESQAGPVVWTFAGDETPWTIGDVYRALDVLVIASHNEGAPLVLKEALACGLPVVMTPVGDGPELDRKHSGIAVFVPLNPSPAQLADGIQEALGPLHQARTSSNQDWILSNHTSRWMSLAWESILMEAAK